VEQAAIDDHGITGLDVGGNGAVGDLQLVEIEVRFERRGNRLPPERWSASGLRLNRRRREPAVER
jgi:hypothetical protein